MKIIGNREALELARKKLGPNAFATRLGKMFFVGTAGICTHCPLRHLQTKGKGRSWSEALKNAGIEIPNSVNGANVPTPEDVQKIAGGGE